MHVIPRLKKILKERELSQTALAQLSGVDQSKISRFDNQKQHKDLELFLISKALGVTIEDLFEITGDDD